MTRNGVPFNYQLVCTLGALLSFTFECTKIYCDRQIPNDCSVIADHVRILSLQISTWILLSRENWKLMRQYMKERKKVGENEKEPRGMRSRKLEAKSPTINTSLAFVFSNKHNLRIQISYGNHKVLKTIGHIEVYYCQVRTIFKAVWS